MTFNATLDHIRPYEAGKPIELVMRDYGIDARSIVKLASNENPHGASPHVIEAVRRQADLMFRYPDDSMHDLKQALAAKFGIDTTQLIIGAGSDQVIDFCIKAKCDANSTILTNKITFAMYEIYAAQIGATVTKTEGPLHQCDEFITLYNRQKADVVFLCLPNNPLGECLDYAEICRFLDQIDPETLVVLDGAYQEYAAYKDSAKAIDPRAVIERYPNVVYLGTFSKAYGLGGMRVGYGIAQTEIIEAFYKLRPPFNITTLSLVAAQAALEDESHVHHSVKECFSEMQRYEAVAEERGFGYIDSYTNFLTYRFKDDRDSTAIAQWLLERGVIVRNLASYGLNGIRITIGTPEQNDRFFTLFNQCLDTQTTA